MQTTNKNKSVQAFIEHAKFYQNINCKYEDIKNKNLTNEEKYTYFEMFIDRAYPFIHSAIKNCNKKESKKK